MKDTIMVWMFVIGTSFVAAFGGFAGNVFIGTLCGVISMTLGLFMIDRNHENNVEEEN